MTGRQERICRLAERAVAVRDPETTLEVLRELRAELEEYERSCVREALADRRSFGAIARALGISRQAAHRRYRELAPGPRLAVSSEARRAVQLARAEAAQIDGGRIASEHLLIGVLRSGGNTASALEAEGLTTDAARACVSVGSDTSRRQRRSADATRVLFAEAAKIAGARGASCVEVEHLALAALSDPDGGAARAIVALGITPAAIRERLSC